MQCALRGFLVCVSLVSTCADRPQTAPGRPLAKSSFPAPRAPVRNPLGSTGRLADAHRPTQPTPDASFDCGPGELSPMEAMHPDQIVPEPEEPRFECRFQREVRCVGPSPVLSAWQMEPFTQCPRSMPRWRQDAMISGAGEPAGFSRGETRKARLANLGAGCVATPSGGDCCYVQFSPTLCR